MLSNEILNAYRNIFMSEISQKLKPYVYFGGAGDVIWGPGASKGLYIKHSCPPNLFRWGHELNFNLLCWDRMRRVVFYLTYA